MRLFIHVALVALLTACSTPYKPPLAVSGSAGFPGVGDLLETGRPLHVLLVHGMCTHEDESALTAMDEIHSAIERYVPPEAATRTVSVQGPGVHIVRRDEQVRSGTVKFRALMWSGMTAPLKRQLAYDRTDQPSDCAVGSAAQCKPVRARYNGKFKDGLLDDCLSDALIYQGASRQAIRSAMIAALSTVIDEGGDSEPVVVVSASLGSKIVFDALLEMLDSPADSLNGKAAKRLLSRLAVIYMEANQLPILGLADQDVGMSVESQATASSGSHPGDSLQRLLARRPQVESVKSAPTVSELKVVAFTDPNDLLSYRLLASRYASLARVSFADILVSNDKTYLGLLENPQTAHLGYATNPDVAALIACGWPKSSSCR